MPTAAILSVIGQDVVVILLGATWRVSGLLLSIMALRGVVEFIEMSQGWLHVASGRAERWKYSAFVSAIVRVAAILAGLPFGAKGVVIALVVAGWLIAFPAVIYAGRPLGIGAALAFRAVGGPLLGAAITVVAGWLLQSIFFSDISSIFRIFIMASLCTAIYLFVVVGALRITEPISILGRLVQDFVARAA
jgi:PST family polysaccharide transporter